MLEVTEKIVRCIDDVRQISIAEAFGMMAMDSVSNPSLRDLVVVLGNSYCHQCNPKNQSMTFYNSSYKVLFFPQHERGVKVIYQAVAPELSFLNDDTIISDWTIENLEDFGIVE